LVVRATYAKAKANPGLAGNDSTCIFSIRAPL
jgi:hypothetical protein